jgi:hypothetical protein
MDSFTSRAGRRPLALALGTLLTAAAIAACSDEPTSSARSESPPNATTLADPFTVTNLNDHGIGSLRWVLSYATGGETIHFDPALAGQTIALDSTLYIRKPVTIEGPAGAGIVLNAQGKDRVLETTGTGIHILRNLSLTGGYHPSGVSSAIRAVDGFPNAVVLENTVVYANHGDAGVAILANKATLINSTVSGTTTDTPNPNYGAIIGDTLELINSTVANNASGGVGWATADRVILRNTILSNNALKNCPARKDSVFIRQGANLSSDDSCGGPTVIVIADPKLGPLAANGGPTLTHALLAGSPGINAGTSCTVAVDQRYVPRDAQCDLGAYEFTDPTSVTLTIDPSVPVSQSNGWSVVSGTVKCSRAETFNIAVQLVQQQKTGKTPTTVDAANIVPVECATIARPWTASMVLTSGAFQNGSATVSAQTVNTQPWVTPASATSAVKLYWARK